jgi:F-type H+-transporting ATPase subunit a
MKNHSNTTSVKALNRIFCFFFALLTVSFSASANPEEGHEAEHRFDPGEMIMHHIADAHQINIIGTLDIPLPVILFHDGHLDVFSSSRFWNGHDAHGHLQFQPYTASSGITYVNNGEVIEVFDANHTSAHTDVHADDAAHLADTTWMVSDSLAQAPVAEPAHTEEHHAVTPLDFSITKSVFGMLLVIVILILVFRSVAKAYTTRAGKAPKGLQNVMEPLILFIRNEVAIPSLGKKKADRYLPFLLTSFFFIWMCNMLGLIPFLGGFNITGTLSITLVLAALVFLITNFSGNAHYWGHIFWPPGVPLPIKFILVPIEIMSIFIKPAVLMIRLTANITAGHIIILAFVSLIILFGQDSPVAGYSIGVGAVLFMIFMFFIELLVAFLQAYVFTLLAALYFGDATQEHHHEGDDHH